MLEKIYLQIKQEVFFKSYKMNILEQKKSIWRKENHGKSNLEIQIISLSLYNGNTLFKNKNFS